MIYKALDNLSIVKDLIIQEMMIKELSEITSINQQNIMNALNQKINKKKNYKKIEIKEATQNISNQVIPSNLYNDLIRLCFSEDENIRNFIFNNFDIHWLQDNDYKVIYDNIYIHLNGENTPIPEIISEQIDDKKIRQKIIDLVFDLDNFEPNKNMAIDCLQRIEKIFIKTKIELVRNKLKESENMSILKELSILEKAFANIKLKYAD